jgi:hypothetical protein
MGHSQNLNHRLILAVEDRDTWVAAYAAWYHHFLAMQPRKDWLAESWARRMTEASLVEFHLREDKDKIRQAALRIPAPPAGLAPGRHLGVADRAPTISLDQACRPPCQSS